MPGSLIHHLPPLVAGKDGGEQLVLSMEEVSRLSTPPFSSQSAVAPLTQPQQHFLQLCPYTADGTRLTATSGSDQELLDCSSLPHSSLWGRRVPAVPSTSPPSPSAETPWYSWRPNTCSLPALPCPTTEAALTLAGLEGRCSPAKGTPGWSRSPCSFSQLSPAHGASLHPGLE